MVTSAKVRPAPALQEAGRRQRRREETSERIFVAAMELLSHKGFAETTVEEITRAADVGKGTFFNYFPSKEHLLGYLVGRQRGVVDRHLELAHEGATPGPALLVSLGRNLLKFPGKSPQMARSVIAAFVGNAEVREYLVGQLAEGRGAIAEMIRLCRQRGELSGPLAASELARAYQHTLFGTVLLWALEPSSPLEKRFTHTMRVFLSGIQTVEQRGSRGKSRTRPAGRKSEAR